MASSKASQRNLVDADFGVSIESWEAATSRGREQKSAIGPIGLLCNSLLEILGLILVELKKRPDVSLHVRSLESSLAALFFWSSDFGVSQGELDEALHDSAQLRVTCLRVLTSIGQFVISSFIRILGNKQRQEEILTSTDMKISLQQAINVLDQQLYPARQPDEDDEALFNTLRVKIDTLIMLGPSLSSPANESFDDEEPRAIDDVERLLPEQAFINSVAQKLPKAAPALVNYLGKLNWERFNHMRRLQRNAAQLELEVTPAETAKTIFFDSALGTSVPAQSETGSESVYAQSMVSTRAESSHKRLPPLPPQARLGQPFTCEICDKQVKYQNTKPWKKHVFNDILAYACFYGECSTQNIFFEDHEAMMGHLEQHHDMDTSTSDVSCPLCIEYTTSERSALSLHLARHMEEIALSILPLSVNPDDSEVDSETEGGIHSKDSDPSAITQEELPGVRLWPGMHEQQAQQAALAAEAQAQAQLYYHRQRLQHDQFGSSHKSIREELSSTTESSRTTSTQDLPRIPVLEPSSHFRSTSPTASSHASLEGASRPAGVGESNEKESWEESNEQWFESAMRGLEDDDETGGRLGMRPEQTGESIDIPGKAQKITPGKKSLVFDKSTSHDRPIVGVRSRGRLPCDACRKRKARCATREDAAQCVFCEMRKQECTFTQVPLLQRQNVLNSDKKEQALPTKQVQPKLVTFELVPTQEQHHLGQYKNRLPIQVLIHPHDTTDSITSTVKSEFELSDRRIFFYRRGAFLVPRYENFENDMVVSFFVPPEAEEKAPEKKSEINVVEEKNENAPRRSHSAFFFFFEEQRDIVREENPNIQRVGEYLGEIWQTMSEEQRAPYEAMSAADKKRLE
ncbi:hypothetical protein NX059_001890 [Plenodomus lindquistii]|nr:hypothetical protein NX059_001890 [Plenodomus lindquistii]